jgi:hypothetical protein
MRAENCYTLFLIPLWSAQVDIGFASRIREFAGMELENALWRFQAKWMPVRVKKTRQNKAGSLALIPSTPE